MTLELISEESISKEAALIEPIWYSNLFDIPSNKTLYKDLWESKLRLREIGDVLTAEGEEWTDEEVIGQIREDAGGWYGEDKSGGWIKAPRRYKKVRVSKLLQNYRDIVKEIPEYLMEAAKGKRKETKGPKNIVEKIYTSGYELDKNGRWVRTERERQKIAGWLERQGWKKDTPLKEGGLTYPIWPQRHRFGQLKKLPAKKGEKREWKQGENLEEERNTQGEEVNPPRKPDTGL